MWYLWFLCSVLETGEELRAALVQGLDTLVAISYVDDDEVGTSARYPPFPVPAAVVGARVASFVLPLRRGFI